MLLDPLVVPVEGVAPLLRVRVECAVVESLDLEVADEVDTLVARVCVGTVGAGDIVREPTLVSESDHMARVKGFDVGGDGGSPIVDDICGALRAAGLVAEFPAEDGTGVLVPLNDEFDVRFVGIL